MVSALENSHLIDLKQYRHLRVNPMNMPFKPVANIEFAKQKVNKVLEPPIKK
jgi:hypothetical protein